MGFCPDRHPAKLTRMIQKDKTVFELILISMRPRHWIKNLFLFVGVFFSHQLLDPWKLGYAACGFAIFCLASSSVYLFNDIIDVTRDRVHPQKSLRPIAAGLLRQRMAGQAAAVLLIISSMLSILIGMHFFAFLVGYLVLNILYSTVLKHLILLDVMCIAAGFMLRVLAGCVLAAAPPSEWLILCSINLSLLLGFSKRRQTLSLKMDVEGRPVKNFSQYSDTLLNQLIAISGATSIIAYLLYAASVDKAMQSGNAYLLLTTPFVLYGIFRYLFLIYGHSALDNPTDIIVSDKPFIANLVCWVVVAFALHYLLQT